MKKKWAFLFFFPLFVFSSYSQEIIENSSKPKNPEAGKVVYLKEIIRINDDKQNPFFIYPSSLYIGIDDGIYVYNDWQIYKFDELGSLIFNIVGRGQGPGEASMRVIYYPTSDGITVLSSSPSKIMKFNQAGEFVEEVKIEKPIHLTEFITLYNDKFYCFLEEPNYQDATRDEDYIDFPNNLCEFDLEFKKGMVKHSFPVQNVVLRRNAWYPRARLNFAFKNSTSLFVSHTAEYKIVKFNIEENKVEKIFKRDYKRIKYPPELNPKPRAGVITSPPREYYYDIIKLLVYKDYLWVLTSAKDEDGNRLVDVFNMEGGYIDSFHLSYPEGRQPRNYAYGTIAIKGDYLYSVDEDDDGYFSIAKYQLNEDLMK